MALNSLTEIGKLNFLWKSSTIVILLLICGTSKEQDWILRKKQFPIIRRISSTGRPYFERPHSITGGPLNFTRQIGTHAFLPCTVKQLGNKSVSWIRRRDAHILTVDRYTFIADERFQILHNGETWTLLIKYVQPRDAGEYECQVTTEPKMSQFLILNVVVPSIKIVGESSDIFVKEGSKVTMKCVISQTIESPGHIFWFHENFMIPNHNNENSNQLQWIEKVNFDTTVATFIIKSAQKNDSGNWSCVPSNLDSVSVMLHILNGKGEHPAAMQQGATSSLCSISHVPLAFYILSSSMNILSTKYMD